MGDPEFRLKIWLGTGKHTEDDIVLAVVPGVIGCEKGRDPGLGEWQDVLVEQIHWWDEDTGSRRVVGVVGAVLDGLQYLNKFL